MGKVTAEAPATDSTICLEKLPWARDFHTSPPWSLPSVFHVDLRSHILDEETGFQPDLLIRRRVHIQTRIGTKPYMLWKQNLWRKGNTFFYLPWCFFLFHCCHSNSFSWAVKTTRPPTAWDWNKTKPLRRPTSVIKYSLSSCYELGMLLCAGDTYMSKTLFLT